MAVMKTTKAAVKRKPAGKKIRLERESHARLCDYEPCAGQSTN